MIDLKKFEHKQIKDLLKLFDHIFLTHTAHKEIREALNVLNLSMRRLIDILENEGKHTNTDEQIVILESQLREYILASFPDAKPDNEIPKFIDDFVDLVQTYYKFVDKETEMVLDMCNVFRVVTEVYLRTDRSDMNRVHEVRDGINMLVDDWLSGRVKPPSSHDEIMEDEEDEDQEAQEEGDAGNWVDSSMETLLLEIKDSVGRVILHRPSIRNAMNHRMIWELKQAFEEMNTHPSVRVVVLTGSGDAFCAGADLKEMNSQSNVDKAQMARDLGDMLQTLYHLGKPVISLVNGPVMGGGMGLVCASDIVVASKDVVFSFPEVRLGIAPAMISYFVVQRIGQVLAKRLLLTGERFSAQTAKQWNVINECVAAAEVDNVGKEYIRQFMSGAPEALRDCKRLIHFVSNSGIDQSLDFSALMFERMLRSDSAKEGIKAFLEKRKPNWNLEW